MKNLRIKLLIISSCLAILGTMLATALTAQAATTITTCAQLQGIDLATNYILESDINCNVAPYNTGSGFAPIGDHNGTRYTGTFDGQGHAITGLFINSTASYVGLFADLSGEVTNLSITGASITTTGDFVGILSGNVREPVDNVHVQGSVTGNGTVGGLAGTVNGSITDSSADVAISAHSRAGGFAGYIDEGEIGDSFATGDVTATTENEAVGGFVGEMGGAVSGSYATGDVTAPDTVKVGGFVGYNGSFITDCYATGDVNGKENVGGFAGHSSGGVFTLSYATGDVTTDGFNYVGGFIGGAVGDAQITLSLATGDVSGVGYDAGGFAGYVDGSVIRNTYARGDVTGFTNVGGHSGFATNSNIQKSYSTGVPTLDGGEDSGGLVGGSSTVDSEGSFWDEETSGMSGSAEGTAKSTAEMKDINTFLDASWDFEEVWTLDEFNDGYPRFSWYTPPDDEEEVDDTTSAYFDSETTGKRVVLEVSGGCDIEDFSEKTEVALPKQDVAYDYPYALVNFTLNTCEVGSTAQITLTFFDINEPTFVLRKFSTRTNAFFTFDDAELIRTEIDVQQAMRATYAITDGGPIDDDGEANGTIVDPVGLGELLVGAPQTGGGGTAN